MPSSTAAWLHERGASAAAIRAHYDLGNDFFALWLDPELLYTCASWGPSGETDLAAAQRAKIDYFAQNLGIGRGDRVLDIGCGWGGALRRFVAVHGAEAGVGLTLSPSQYAFVAANSGPQVSALLSGWVDYAPEIQFDGIVCIEAVEAFAKRHLARADKVAIYRAFFERCHAWLKPGRRLGLQMIAYGNARPEHFDKFIATDIFPESDLPFLSEMIEASEGLFEPITLQNDRADYVRTLRAWLAGLKAGRDAARAIVGAPTVKKFEDYLRLSWLMFDRGACDLHRIIFRRIDALRFAQG
jgi:cyclopropane-fatty-acyl-phospholipid synthase